MNTKAPDQDMLAMNALWQSMRGGLSEAQLAMFRTAGNMPISNALEVYKVSYWSRIYEALAETFPLTLEALGEPRFRTVVARFVHELPSIQPELEHCGARLPQFLRDRLRSEDDDIADVAAFEQACLESFMAPNQKVTATLDQIDAARFAETVFIFVGHMRLAQVSRRRLELVDSEAAANSTETNAEEPVCFAIHRPLLTVMRTQISSEEFGLLQSAFQGASVAELLAHLDNDPHKLLPYMQRWFSLQLIERMDLS